MCTVSWRHDDDGYELFFNRDELRARERGLPPRMFERSGVRMAAPVDATAGGTWLTVNEHGVTVCLLNRYPRQQGEDDRSYESRGNLVMELAPSATEASVLERLASLDVTVYRPFTLVVLAPGPGARMAWWDGWRLTVASDPARQPLSSSSYDPDSIDLWRRQEWAAMEEQAAVHGNQGTAAAHTAFHRSHQPARGPYSPCMHRADARTVSFCHVRVTGDAVSLAYADGPPCRSALGEPLVLERRALLATA